jgi:hypothetical protein
MPIRFYSFSIQVMVLIALVTGAVSLYLYQEVQREAQAVRVVLASVPKGSSHFSLTLKDNPGRCFGGIDSTLTEEKGQVSLSYTAWLGLRVGDTEQVQEASGSLMFNPLGQLGGALVQTTIKGTSVRVGTLNINPITLVVHVGPDSSTPLFQQNIPGPITVNHEGEIFTIRAPALRSKASIPPAIALPTGLPKLQLTPTRCSRTKHDHLQLSLESLSQFSGVASHLFPGGML